MLQTILQSVRRRLPEIIASERSLRSAARSMPPPRSFDAALLTPGLQVIAEIKRRSPSAGDIAVGLDPAAQASLYAEGGAAAISVLTESEFFGGSIGDLQAVRHAVDLPILRKDFVVHRSQIWEARAAGADAVLLIVAALDDTEIRAMLDVAGEAGIAALVEAHTAGEALRAVDVGAQIVGINNRDLRTFVTDLGVAESMIDSLGPVRVKVAESGVSSPHGAARMARVGYDAILVGEAAVRAPDPSAFISGLREAAE
jgi:indole-3-glycerol phosphate synthase